jgi:hypothetical protein
MTQMSKRILTVLLAGLAALGAACAQDLGDRMLLRYKWNVGEQITWNVSIEAEGDLLMSDLTKQPAEEERVYMVRTMNMPIYQTIEVVDEGGNATVGSHIGLLDIGVSVGGRPARCIVIDPEAKTMTVDGEQAPMPEAALGFLGAEFRMVMSPLGEVLKFDAPFAQGQLFDMAGISLGDFAQMNQASQIQFPAEPIQEGYTWAQTKELRAAPTSEEQEGEDAEDEAADAEDEAAAPPPLAMTMVYTLEGFETVDDVNCAKVELVGAMDMREPFRVHSTAGGADFTVETGPAHVSMHGFIYFDPEAGCMVKSEVDSIMDVRQTTQGQVQAGDQTRDVNLTVNIEGFVQRAAVKRQAEG